MGSFAAVREHLNAPIGQVYGVTFDLQLARMPRCRGAVIHALHPACHKYFFPITHEYKCSLPFLHETKRNSL